MYLDSLDHGGIIVAVLSHDVASGNPIGTQSMQNGSREPCSITTTFHIHTTES